MFDCTAYFIRLSYTTRHIDRVMRYMFSYLYKSHFSFLRRINRKKIYLNRCKKYIWCNIKLVMLFSSLRIMLYSEIENTQSLNYDWGDYICHMTTGRGNWLSNKKFLEFLKIPRILSDSQSIRLTSNISRMNVIISLILSFHRYNNYLFLEFSDFSEQILSDVVHPSFWSATKLIKKLTWLYIEEPNI